MGLEGVGRGKKECKRSSKWLKWNAILVACFVQEKSCISLHFATVSSPKPSQILQNCRVGVERLIIGVFGFRVGAGVVCVF
jgi:hypothetical protein